MYYINARGSGHQETGIDDNNIASYAKITTKSMI